MIVRLLGRDDANVLEHVAADVFDYDILPDQLTQFLDDPRHHLAVAIEDGIVVGMASAIHYVHPDKSPEMFVNEVGVASTHQRRGIGRQLMQALFERARALGCDEAWVTTDETNTAAQRMYASVGGIEQRILLFGFRL